MSLAKAQVAAEDPEKMEIVEESSEKESESSFSDSPVDSKLERRLMRRIDIRIVPASMCLYLMCSLDRSNIGNAKVLNSDLNSSLQQTIHASDADFNNALMVFFISYILFETPSNILLHKFRPSRWLAFLMFGWGAMTICLGAIRNFAELTVVRFLLGTFEAGLFPGLVYLFTLWYRPEERAIRIALIQTCATIAGAFGGAIAFGVGKMNGIQGLPGWRWLFFIEGAPSCIIAVLIFFFFPDYPEVSRWLSPTEKDIVVTRLKGVASLGHDKITWKEAKETLLDWRLYVHYSIMICVDVPFSSITLFTPTIVSGLGYRGLDAQLFTVPPYAIAFVVTVTVAWLGDRYGIYSWCNFLCMCIAGTCFVVEGALPPTAFKARYIVLCIGVPFSLASMPPLLTWLAGNVRTTTAAALSAPLNVSIGSIGQLLGVYIYQAKESPGYRTGHFTNAGFILFGACTSFCLRMFYLRRNARLAAGERKWQL